jgi:N-acetylmuramoyl-L-alanine amidase
LPERLISAKPTLDLIVGGKLYPQVKIKALNNVVYVPFAKVFPQLDCQFDGEILSDPLGQKYELRNGSILGAGVNESYRILKDTEGIFVPLVQTLKITGYAAYFSDNTVYITPRIKELAYQKDITGTRLIIKANNKILPKTIVYLKKPYRCLIDIPNATFDAPQNGFMVNDKFCTQVRGAQFDRGIARIVLELPDEKIKPVLTYSEGGQLLGLVLDGQPVITSAKVVGQKKTEEPELIRLDDAREVKPEKVFVVDVPGQSEIMVTGQVQPTQPISLLPSRPEKFAIVKKPEGNVMKGLKVAILPGHGGEDVGAISRTGYMEKYPTLEVSKKLAKLLSDAGAIPLLCREDDRNVSLDDQAEFAIKNNADILISVHFNAFTDESVGGAEAYYYKDIDYALAKAVHEEIVRTTGAKNKGLKKAQMHNLNHTTMPGVLIEPLFISNRREEMLIRSDIYQWKLAKAVYNGVENYLREKNK